MPFLGVDTYPWAVNVFERFLCSFQLDIFLSFLLIFVRNAFDRSVPSTFANLNDR
jgi:hypothetical protein